MEKNKNLTYNSMISLIHILKVFCLNCNIEETSFKSNFTIVRIVFTILSLGCFNFVGLYYKIIYVYQNIDLSIKITDFVQMISDFSQYVVDLYFVYKYGRHICVEYFKQFECIDRILNLTCFSMMKSKLHKLMFFFTAIWAISSSLDFGAWCLANGWLPPVCHSITYVFLLIKMLTIVDLMAHIIHIEIRLRVVGDLMQDCYSSTNACPDGITTDCLSNNKWLYKSDGINTHVRKWNCNNTKEVKALTTCYLLLTEQVSFINKIYGFRIMLNSLSLLSDMIKITNIAVRIILGSQRTSYASGYFPVMSSLVRLITCAAIFITLVNQSERAYRQRERIVNVIDHLLYNKNPDDDLRDAVENFRGLIQDRLIVFNMANFFSLNYSLLMSLASVVVTYTIILLQTVN